MEGRSCVVVLIGSQTARRKWINYEIEKGWNDGKGVVGIYIHRLKDQEGKQTVKGSNPFDFVKVDVGVPDYLRRIQFRKIELSRIVKAHDPPYTDSRDVYNYIEQRLADWVQEAIAIRKQY